MFSPLAISNQGNQRAANAERFTETFYGYTIYSRGPNFTYRIFWQFAVIRFFVSRWIESPSSFYGRVLHIVGYGSGKEMGRIHAWWIVAPVKNLESIWYRAIGKLPCHAMGSDHIVWNESELISDSSVATLDTSSCPEPARTKLWAMHWSRSALIDLWPESFSERDILRHRYFASLTGKVLRAVGAFARSCGSFILTHPVVDDRGARIA